MNASVAVVVVVDVVVVVVAVVVVVDSGFNGDFVVNMGNWVLGVSVAKELTAVFVVPTAVWVIAVAFASF